MPSTRVGDVDLYYEERGSGGPVVLVHGIPTDYRAWGAQMGPLSEKYRVLSVSRRYAAPNERKGDLRDSTVENNAADLVGLIEKLSLPPVNLIGHSYGGFVSALVASEHGNMVRSLVLVEPAVSTMLVQDQESKAQMLRLFLTSPSVALAARRFQTRSLYPALKSLDAGDLQGSVNLISEGLQDTPGALERLPESTRKMMLDNARTVGELRTSFPRFGADEAGRIACRTLLVSGEFSPLWLRRIATLLGRSIPKSRNIAVQGARHFPHLERPEEFNSRVLGFLAEA